MIKNKKEIQYTHKDQLNQTIRPNQPIAFAYSYSPGLRIGIVQKLTPQRVKIVYKYRYQDSNGNIRTGEWMHQARPERTLVLSDTLQQELTLAKLQGKLP